MSQVDVFLCFINVSNNVRYLDFVACISWKYSANKWLEMVFTDRSYQTIVWRNVVSELAWDQCGCFREEPRTHRPVCEAGCRSRSPEWYRAYL